MTQEEIKEMPVDMLYIMLKFAKQKGQHDNYAMIDAEFKRRGIDLDAKLDKPKYKRLGN